MWRCTWKAVHISGGACRSCWYLEVTGGACGKLWVYQDASCKTLREGSLLPIRFLFIPGSYILLLSVKSLANGRTCMHMHSQTFTAMNLADELAYC